MSGPAIKAPLPGKGNATCPVGSAMFPEQAWKELGRSLRLSQRELEIVRGIFDDETVQAIGARLGISPHTIHTHCGRLYHKLAVTDRVKLVLRVVDAFLALTTAKDSALPPVCATRTAGRCPLLQG